MEADSSQLLKTILLAEEIEQTAPVVLGKFQKYVEVLYDKYCKEKAAANRVDDYRQQLDDLQSKNQDYEHKIKSYEENVLELRSQLDRISGERHHLLDAANNSEKEMSAIRLEKNLTIEERDSLLKRLERQNSELERLQQEIDTYQRQLKCAIAAKCEAITRVDDIESREVAFDLKERRMDQEREMLHNQIQALSEDLNRNISELQNIRRENTVEKMHLEARLTEKIEELRICQAQCANFKETISRLSQSLQESNNKLLNHKEEAVKMIEYYKQELAAQVKLTEVYKGNYQDVENGRDELKKYIAELKQMLNEATDQYGVLETEKKASILHLEKELEEANKQISLQKDELKHANDLLKEVRNESVDNAISKIAPSAAISSRLIRSDMSLTEVYSLYVKCAEELSAEKRQNDRLKLQLKEILLELSENAPNITKQQIEYEKLLDANNILKHQRDELLQKQNEGGDLMIAAESNINQLQRENKKLKLLQSDLNRQVCYLLQEVESLRIGASLENNTTLQGNMSTTNDVISKKLVTFNSITELQDNNQKLLFLVRDLSAKLEECEILKQEMSVKLYDEKNEEFKYKMQDLQEILNQQNSTISTLLSKCDRYKKLYFDLQKQQNNNKSFDMDLSEDENSQTINNSAEISNKLRHSSKPSDSDSERIIRELKQQIKDIQDSYKSLKEQYDYYTKESKNNEKLLNEQYESMRLEVRELTSANCKLMNNLEFSKEQIKTQQNNISSYKQQISVLEDRNKNYETTIIKHEQTVLLLKDEILKSQRGQSVAEREANSVRNELRMVRETANRLQAEREVFYRQHQNQNLLLNNIEIIKSNLERSETEGRARLEDRLDQAARELAAQRRHFQEQENLFRETINDLQRQTESAKKCMDEEREQAEKLRQELIAVREELTNKALQIDDLSKKLQESLSPKRNDNPIVLANKKAREYELKFEEAKIIIESLKTDLNNARQHAAQYQQLSQSAETEIRNLHESHQLAVSQLHSKIREFEQAEIELKSKITELETEIQLSSVNDNVNTNQPEQLNKFQEERKEYLQKLSESNRQLRDLQISNKELSECLSVAENKYAHEMVQRSSDVQELSKTKQELHRVQGEINEIIFERDTAREELKEMKERHVKITEQHETEQDNFEKRVQDLNTLNANLHDQIEALTKKLTILSQTHGDNSSVMDISLSENNRSLTEEDEKNCNQLLQIIKYLRKEKDLINAKLDILKAENIRLVSEYTVLQKKVDELNNHLNQERTKAESAVDSASKHEEILRKIETLNAVTDSNRILREERDALKLRERELTERNIALEGEIVPLQKQNSELNSKLEEATADGVAARTEAMKWRQRANVLVEKSNKNPEEFKRLQLERENLAKMLTSEKDLLKQTTDELNSIKAERQKLELDRSAIEKQLQHFIDDNRKVIEDHTNLKQNHARLMQELMELKNKVLQREEMQQKLSEDLESKEAQLQDSKNKEIQIRKIAKRYKDSYVELLKKSTTSDGSAAVSQENIELGTSGGGDGAATTTEMEQQRSTIESLNNSISSLQEDIDKVRKENEELRASVDIEERTKNLLHNAKSRIVSLTEAKNSADQEIKTLNNKVQDLVVESENRQSEINSLKIKYDEIVARLEKERFDSNHNKDAISRLRSENSTLVLRNNQLTAQLGVQQSAKPSTSSVAITEKGSISESSPRTANVKPMSGSTTVQQSATVTPWRGGDTPLASIRPLSVPKLATILPTSQQSNQGNSSSSNTPSSASCSNTALVPPQQQVHTTGSTSLESMSPSPTSSHTDYMPSTSSASVAVAAIPPMGSGSVSAPESSQEAESIQQLQHNESQLPVCGVQQQVVALVSPRVEGSSQNEPSPILQLQQDPSNQQPSTSGTTSSSSHIAVSSHNRHAPSSSNVTTTQAGSSGGHKRPRDPEGDSSTSAEESGGEKSSKHPKRVRNIRGGEIGVLDVEYQVPTSSQRDQEDDIVVVDSEDDDGMAEADDGPVDDDGTHEGYEDSYEQDQDMDENIVQGDAEADNNEADVDECVQNQAQCTSVIDNQADVVPYSTGPSTSQQAIAMAHSHQTDNHQQSQAISSGSYDSSTNVQKVGSIPWNQASSTSTRQQIHLTDVDEKDSTQTRKSESNVEIASSKFGYSESMAHSKDNNENESKVGDDEAADESDVGGESYSDKNDDESNLTESQRNLSKAVDNDDGDEDFHEDESINAPENADIESHNSNGATQSEFQEIQQSQNEVTSEDNEGVDGVSSEGEKQAVEEIEEEGREAEATTTPSINTRSKSTKNNPAMRRGGRGYQRGARPTPIVWQDAPGHSRNAPMSQRNQEQPSNPFRGYPNPRSSQRSRRMKRPAGNNYSNMRY